MQHQILIVEDDESLRFIYSTTLRIVDAGLTLAKDGEEAVAFLADHAPHLIILDMLLPQMPGDQVLEYIYAAPHLENTRVLIVTAHEGYRTLALRPGDRFLMKPVINGSLRKVVNDMLALIPTH